jgi:hypothetical protein
VAAKKGKKPPASRELGATVHMPRIGCGLAGGTWDRIEPLIQNRLIAAGVHVTPYDLAPNVALSSKARKAPGRT